MSSKTTRNGQHQGRQPTDPPDTTTQDKARQRQCGVYEAYVLPTWGSQPSKTRSARRDYTPPKRGSGGPPPSLTLAELERHVERLVLLIPAVELDDVGVVELVEQLRLAPEGLQVAFPELPSLHDLHGGLLAVRLPRGAPDDRKRPLTELLCDETFQAWPGGVASVAAEGLMI